MSEFMGNVRGIYDAKTTGFLPGGASLHRYNGLLCFVYGLTLFHYLYPKSLLLVFISKQLHDWSWP